MHSLYRYGIRLDQELPCDVFCTIEGLHGYSVRLDQELLCDVFRVQPYSLACYRALGDKLSLLDQAVTLMDGNAITAVSSAIHLHAVVAVVLSLLFFSLFFVFVLFSSFFRGWGGGLLLCTLQLFLSFAVSVFRLIVWFMFCGYILFVCVLCACVYLFCLCLDCLFIF